MIVDGNNNKTKQFNNYYKINKTINILSNMVRIMFAYQKNREQIYT